MNGMRVAPVEPDVHLRGRAPYYAFVPGDEGITLREFLLFLWRSRWFALAAGLICGIGAAAASWLVTPEYTATVVMLPVSGGGGLSSLGSSMSGLSGLASLAGINLNGANEVKTEALATLQSSILTEKYIQQHNLLPVLYAREWNPATKQWDTTDPGKLPTLWKANRRFKHIRSVVDDTKTGLVTLAIRWKNPYLAAQWANGFVKLTNDYLRQRTVDEAERSIAYLNSEVSRTNVVEVKSAIYELMEEEIKKEMVAKGRNDFALRVIDPAQPPEKESFPRPVLWTAGAILGGIFLGLLISVVRETMADQRTSAPEPNRTPSNPAGASAAALKSEMDRP